MQFYQQYAKKLLVVGDGYTCIQLLPEIPTILNNERYLFY